MKILITGARGFVGKNLCAQLKNIAEGKDKTFDIKEEIVVFEYDVDTDGEENKKSALSLLQGQI